MFDRSLRFLRASKFAKRQSFRQVLHLPCPEGPPSPRRRHQSSASMGLEDGDAQGWTTHTRRTNADTRLSLTSKGIDEFDFHGQRHKTDLYEHETGSATKRSSKEKSGEEARRLGQKKTSKTETGRCPYGLGSFRGAHVLDLSPAKSHGCNLPNRRGLPS